MPFSKNSASRPSLAEVHRSIRVPDGRGFWRKMLAYAGPGYLVSVGYMDPGNWATDIAGGSKFGYSLLSVILLSNLMAILLQSLLCALRCCHWTRFSTGLSGLFQSTSQLLSMGTV